MELVRKWTTCIWRSETQANKCPSLTFYDPARPLILENDAGEYGLGSTLRQDGRPVGYASCMLTGTEQRYAQIEKEMLAVTDLFTCTPKSILYDLHAKLHQYVFKRLSPLLRYVKTRFPLTEGFTDETFFFFFWDGGKYAWLGKSHKKLPHLFQGFYFDLIPFPRVSCHVTEPDLNSPLEGPRSAFLLYSRFIGSQVGFLLYSRFFGVSYMQYIQLGSHWRLYMQNIQLGHLPLRDKGIPPDRQLYFCLSRRKAGGPGHKDPSSPRSAKFKCVTRTLWS